MHLAGSGIGVFLLEKTAAWLLQVVDGDGMMMLCMLRRVTMMGIANQVAMMISALAVAGVEKSDGGNGWRRNFCSNFLGVAENTVLQHH